MKNKRVLATILSLMLMGSSATAEGNQTNLIPKNIIETAYPNWFLVQKGACYVDEIFSFISSLPEELIRSFVEKNNIFIICSDKNAIEKKYDIKRVIALYDANNDIIWVESPLRTNLKSELLKKGVPKEELAEYTNEKLGCLKALDSVIHELAHFLDNYPNFIYSGNPEFFDIYISEKEAFKQTKQFRFTNCFEENNINSSYEYFASSLSAYYLFGDDLKELVPRTYEYIDQLINSLSYGSYGM